jgi:hypothetical protein
MALGPDLIDLNLGCGRRRGERRAGRGDAARAALFGPVAAAWWRRCLCR